MKALGNAWLCDGHPAGVDDSLPEPLCTGSAVHQGAGTRDFIIDLSSPPPIQLLRVRMQSWQEVAVFDLQKTYQLVGHSEMGLNGLASKCKSM